MASNFKLDLVTPEGRAFSDEADGIVLTGGEGEMGILPGHEPVSTTVLPGSLVISKDGKELEIIIGSGYAEITGHYAHILTDSAVRADKADPAAIADARKRAEKARAEILASLAQAS
jgi:F-type H+-transporting ATPase subunit epsilon